METKTIAKIKTSTIVITAALVALTASGAFLMATALTSNNSTNTTAPATNGVSTNNAPGSPPPIGSQVSAGGYYSPPPTSSGGSNNAPGSPPPLGSQVSAGGYYNPPLGSDVTPPTTAITSPTNGQTVSGAITIKATANDNVGVTRVNLYIGNSLVGTRDTAPYTFSWDTTMSTNGAYTLQTKAYDAAGNVGTSAVVNVTALNGPPDVTPPTTAIISPMGGQILNGIVTVKATASDNVGVTVVTLYRNNNPFATLFAPPYNFIWDTTSSSPNGAYALTTKAYDAANNVGASAVVNVTVKN